MKLRTFLAVLLLCTTAACSATYRVSPAQYVPVNLPREIVVVDNSGHIYVLEQPAMEGETLKGVQRGTPDTVSLDVSRVQEALVRKKSPVRTAILVGALAAGATAAIVFGQGGKGESCKLIYAQDDVPGKNELCDTSG